MGPKSKISSEIKQPLLPEFVIIEIFHETSNLKCSRLVDFFSKDIFSIINTAYIVFWLYAAWEIRDSKLITHGLLSSGMEVNSIATASSLHKLYAGSS